MIAVVCHNLSTGQTVQRDLQSRYSWDCEEMGLEVEPGDEVITSVVGDLN